MRSIRLDRAFRLRGSGRRRRGRGLFARAARTRRGEVGLGLTLAVVAIAGIGPLVAPHSPTAFTTVPFATPGHGALLGGDFLGRDALSRLLNGGWQLLLMALASTAFGITVGTMVGVSAAYLRGVADGMLMRTVDVFLAFPQIVFALLLVSMLGPQVWLIVVAVGLGHAPQVARVIRAATLDVSERDYVKAIELQGVSRLRMMRSEILPNLTSPLAVETGLRLTYSIIIIAGLSFIGFGLQPPTPNWGTMISENRLGLTANSLGVLAPTVLLAVLTVGMNTFTDAVARVAIGVDREQENRGLLEAKSEEAIVSAGMVGGL